MGAGSGEAGLPRHLAPVSYETGVGDAELCSARPMAPGCEMVVCPDPQSRNENPGQAGIAMGNARWSLRPTPQGWPMLAGCSLGQRLACPNAASREGSLE